MRRRAWTHAALAALSVMVAGAWPAAADKARPMPAAKAKEEPGATHAGKGAPAAEAEAPAAKEFFYYDAKGKRDPFIPLVRDGMLVQAASHGVMSVPVLRGILWDQSGGSLALINDLEVKVGDMVGEYQVTQIRPDKVVLTRDGEPVELMFDATAPPVTREEGAGGHKVKNAKGGERRR